MGNLGVLGADGLKQPGAKFRPAIFESGTRVFQASAVGAALSDAALRPFEDGLHFDLEKSAAAPT